MKIDAKIDIYCLRFNKIKTNYIKYALSTNNLLHLHVKMYRNY